MEKIKREIQARLDERREAHSLRSLSLNTGRVDFLSNDYLGFARSPELKEAIETSLQSYPAYRTGSSGSRLLYGNDAFTEQLEAEIAAFHGAGAGLIFNSGYAANIGLFSAIARRGDTIICDDLIHASIIDGARLSNANRYSFAHNDLQSLEAKLKLAKGNIFIAVESIYSMDGDEAPLEEISTLAEHYHAALIVDEAHATGIFGVAGRGLVSKYELNSRVFARIITFGKSLGTHGAIILGDPLLRTCLINFARSFIYSTAAPFHSHLSVKMAYHYLFQADHPSLIAEKIQLFRELYTSAGLPLTPGTSPIQSLVTGGNSKTKALAAILAEKGLDIRPILHPTVPEGTERLRICLHTFNTSEEIELLVSLLKQHI